jgi:hypothetical protein
LVARSLPGLNFIILGEETTLGFFFGLLAFCTGFFVESDLVMSFIYYKYMRVLEKTGKVKKKWIF